MDNLLGELHQNIQQNLQQVRLVQLENLQIIQEIDSGKLKEDYEKAMKTISEKTAEFLMTLNLFQLAIMIGLVIALMCNFYSIRKPGWQEIAFKALSFGLIVTFWPIYLFILIVMTCYSKCIKEDEEEVKNFRARYMSASGPTFRLLENVTSIGLLS